MFVNIPIGAWCSGLGWTFESDNQVAGPLDQTTTVQWRLDGSPGLWLNRLVELRCRVGLDRAQIHSADTTPWCNLSEPAMWHQSWFGRVARSVIFWQLGIIGRGRNVTLLYDPVQQTWHWAICAAWHCRITYRSSVVWQIRPSSKRSERERRYELNTTHTWQQGLWVCFLGRCGEGRGCGWHRKSLEFWVRVR